MKQTSKWKQFKSTEDLYDRLLLALWDRLYKSKKHKAYYLFSVLFSEGWWLKDNLNLVRKAVLNHSLNLIWKRRNPNEKDDDNINIYFLENEKGQFFIVLVLDPFGGDRLPEILDIIPVKRNDYEMTQIYPQPARPLKSTIHKNTTPFKSGGINKRSTID